MPKLLLSLWLLLLAGCIYRPPVPSQAAAFRAATAQLRHGNYAAAIRQYQQLERQGVAEPALFGNLGTAFYKAGRVGWAAFYYEKARAAAPFDAQLMANQRTARSTPPPIGAGTYRWWPALAAGTWLKAADALAQVAAYSFLLGGLCYLASTAGRAARQKKLVAACRFFLLASALLLGAAGGLLLPFHRPAAIIVGPKTSVRSGPSPAASQLFEVSEGEKVEIQRQYRDWLKIRTSRGAQGWVSTQRAARLPT